MIEFLVGPATEEWYPVLREELALDGADHRAPAWTKADLAPDRPFRVAVIGAGMSGLLAAHRLRQAGVDVTILEKDADVGGTWYENIYPGCRVDVPNHFYSYSFAQSADWPQFFSTQPVLLDYFRSCADDFELRHLIRFGTEVVEARFDERRAALVGHDRGPCDGAARRIEPYDVVVSRRRPAQPPEVPRHPRAWASSPGRRSTRPVGPRRRARRQAGGDHRHRRQRGAVHPRDRRAGRASCSSSSARRRGSPPPRTTTTTCPDALRWLMHHVPDYAHWDRLWVFWRMHEGLLPVAGGRP